MCDLGCVSAPPTLLHLALMVDEDDGEFSGQKINTCLTLLSHLLPELCYEIEIPDHLGKCDMYIYIVHTCIHIRIRRTLHFQWNTPVYAFVTVLTYMYMCITYVPVGGWLITQCHIFVGQG